MLNGHVSERMRDEVERDGHVSARLLRMLDDFRGERAAAISTELEEIAAYSRHNAIVLALTLVAALGAGLAFSARLSRSIVSEVVEDHHRARERGRGRRPHPPGSWSGATTSSATWRARCAA